MVSTFPLAFRNRAACALGALVSVVSVVAAGCLPDVVVDDPDVQLTCTSDDECPPEFACKVADDGGRCIASSVLAKTPIAFDVAPALVGGPVFSTHDGFNSIAVTFTLSEAPRRLAVSLGDAAFACDDAGDAAFACSLVVDDNVAAGAGVVHVVARDAAENVVDEGLDVVVDVAAPVVARSNVTVFAPGRLVDRPAAATVGSTLVVDVFFDEALSAAPASITLSPGGEACTDIALSSSSTSLSCEAVITDGTAATRALTFTTEDVVGNGGDIEAALDVVFDFDAPAAPDVDTDGLLVLHRAPWGTREDAAASFVVSVADGAVAADEGLAVFADAAGAQLLGVRAPTGSGSGSGDVDTGALDHAVVFVAAVDGAGLTSPLVAVTQQTWTASFGGKIGTRVFENPHQIFAGTFDDALFSADERELADASPLHPGDAGAVTSTTTAAWAQRLVSPEPPPRARGCLAFDAARGRAVLFGGEDDGGDVDPQNDRVFDDTWTFSDGRWQQEAPPSSPPSLRRVACAYDAVRDVVVLVGGSHDGVANSDVWQFDGRTWSIDGSLDNVVDAADLAAHAEDTGAAFDGSRVVVAGFAADRTVVVGDSIDVVTTVSPVSSSGAGPVVVAGPTGVVFAAESTAFEFADDRWRAIDPLPLPAVDAVGFVDSDGAITLIVPDANEDRDTRLRLAPAGWEAGVDVPVDDRRGAMAASLGDDTALLFGGDAVDGPQTFLLSGARALPLSGAPLAPSTTDIAQAAFDPGDDDEFASVIALSTVATGSTVMRVSEMGVAVLGSSLGGVLVDGDVGIGGAHRAALVGNAGLVFDFNPDGSGESFAQRIVDTDAFGGRSVDGGRGVRVGDDLVVVLAGGATFTLSDDVWRSEVTGPVPAAGFGTAVARNAAGDDVVVLFPDVSGHTWTFANRAWTDLGASGPSLRTNVGLARDADSGHVFAFGGFVGVTATAELWEFSADDGWSQRRESGPGARAGGAFAFDERRHRLVAAGGLFSADEVWDWNSAAADAAALHIAINVGAAQIDGATVTGLLVDLGPNDDAIDLFVWQSGAWQRLRDVDVGHALTGPAPTLHLAAVAGPSTSLADVQATLSFRSQP